jgi:pimeloyl-ACP methyl ester carboxylesterase
MRHAFHHGKAVRGRTAARTAVRGLAACAIAASLAACSAAQPTTAGPAPSGPGRSAGEVVSSQQVSPTMFKLTYTSVGQTGQPVVVSGTLVLPPGTPPQGGWPVVSETHGTVGYADACAPSATTKPEDFTPLLDQGYAVASTDYEGLGTPGPHPYQQGASAARSAIDIVRAAHTLAPGKLSKAWAVMGQSQGGHAALYTASMATSYAAELDFRGAVATAPPTSLSRLALDRSSAKTEERTLRTALYPLFVLSAKATRPGLDPAEIVTGKALPLLKVAEEKCLFDIHREVVKLGIDDTNFWRRPPLDIPEIRSVMAAMDVPVKKYDRPLFIAQGGKDAIVQAPVTADFAQRIKDHGSDVVYTEYPKADHDVPATAWPDVKAWLAERL